MVRCYISNSSSVAFKSSNHVIIFRQTFMFVCVFPGVLR
jgi:hypothetical protein